MSHHQTGTSAPSTGDSRTQSRIAQSCALVVAGVAAYSSYAHQRQFALVSGADQIAATLWPLSVDGLVILASIGLLKDQAGTSRRARWAVRCAFLLGVAVSLAANIAAAPSLTWQPVVVAGWPPLALLLAVEMVMHSRDRETTTENAQDEPGSKPATVEPINLATETTVDSQRRGHSETRHDEAQAFRNRRQPSTRRERPRPAEDTMWDYYQRETAQGRTPTGAELDRAAGTSNYGRAVLARWRRNGRIPIPAA